MSLILVVEKDESQAAQIREALAAEGWRVQVVGDREEALAAMRAESPDLLVVDSRTGGAVELCAEAGSGAGGPGALALVPSGVAAPEGADATLEEPFEEPSLRGAVRRCLSRVQRAAAEAAAQEAASAGTQLTSQELFGDVLAEVEEEVTGRRRAPTAPAAAPAPAARRPASASQDDVERQLEQTLSGVLGKRVAPRAAEPSRPRRGDDVDDLLSQTLSGLGVVSRAKKIPEPESSPLAPQTLPSPAAAPTTPPGPQAPSAMSVASAAPPSNEPAATVAPLPSAPVAASAAVTPEPPLEEVAAEADAAGEMPIVESAVDESTVDEVAADEITVEGVAVAPISVQPSEKSAAPSGPLPAAPATPAPSAPPEPVAGDFATQRLEAVRLPPQPEAAAPTGQRFGQYTLLERVAVGGMAEVWKARMQGMEGFQKTVAIKRILPHLTDSVDFLTMFVDEAKLAAQLNHPHIIHIYDLGKLDDDYYIAMEFVEGKDLRTILNEARRREQPLPLPLALLVASRLASALDYAHRKRDFDNRELGLVHRDVSPQNVLISYEGDIKLCDFGIVKAVAKASKTQMGALKGKLQYMSPEQAWGRVVDARSDIFSLGAVLFEMLTGKRLFAGDSEISVLESVRDCRIRAPRELEPELPAAVDAIVLKALARDPDDRYQTAGEMQQELEAYLYSLKPTPSQADLARYMRGLFASEVASLERQPDAPAGEAALGAVDAVPALAPTAGEAVVTEERKGRGLLWGGIAAAVLIVGAIAVLLQTRHGSPGEPAPSAASPVAQAAAPVESPTASAAVPVKVPAPTPAAGAAKAPAGGVDVQRLVDRQLQAREEQLRKQFEEQKKKLESELEKVNTPADEAQPTAANPTATHGDNAAQPPQTAGRGTPPAAAAPATTDRSAPPKSPPAAEASNPVEAETAPPAAAGANGAAARPPESTAPPETSGAPTPTVATPPAASVPSATAAPPQPAPAPKVKTGDLIELGDPDLAPPSLVSIEKPEYPPVAKRLRVQGTVIVAVLVDENGRVADTRLIQEVGQNVGLNEAAVRAARSARFKPATKDGVRVKVWFNLTVPFKL